MGIILNLINSEVIIRVVEPDLLYPDPQNLMNSDPDPGQ